MPFVSSTAPCCEDERLVHFPHVCRRNALLWESNHQGFASAGLPHTPSLLAWVRTTFRTGMKAEVSLKLLVLTMCVWMFSPSW